MPNIILPAKNRLVILNINLIKIVIVCNPGVMNNCHRKMN